MTAVATHPPAAAKRNRRWSAITIFFIFLLLHQTDKLLIGPMQQPIMDTFHIDYTQWGLINTGALVVGSLLYPLWGWLSDKYNRARLLSLAALIWGSTTWLSAIAPNFNVFLVTRSSTGIDDSSYPGLYSLVADYFEPKTRGKIYGFLQLAQPLGYLMGMLLALMLSGVIGWRAVFYITGSLGLVLAVALFFGVKDVPRGSGEEELKDVDKEQYKFSWKVARDLFKIKSMLMVYGQGFFGVFPWNVITYFFFGYLETERGYDANTMILTMAPAVIILALGYPLGGWLGDWLFKKTKRGRLIVAEIGGVLGAVFFYFTMTTPNDQPVLFSILLMITAIFLPLPSPNVLSTIYDVTLPEVRSTANAIESFIENIGAASAPLITGIIADATSLKFSILVICMVTWAVCLLIFLGAIYLVPRDINHLHQQLRERAAIAK